MFVEGEAVALFSERYGHVPVRETIQTESLDEGTRIAVWNILHPFIQRKMGPLYEGMWRAESFTRIVWTQLETNPIDDLQRVSGANFVQMLKERVLLREWHQALDLVEFAVRYEERIEKTGELAPRLNQLFSSHLVGYRVVEQSVVPVTGDVEVEAIESALGDANLNAGTSAHLKNALRLLSDRTSPDYANSIKESISAVEAFLREQTGKTTLSDGLKEAAKRGAPIHPTLSAAWGKLYAYAGDSDGIRHGSITESEATEALATYMLVATSGFINYLVKAYGK